VIRRHFAPFGEVERINVIYDKNIAFVRYYKRANAEFAKEAMEHQALDAGEIINVRWANDDPNPRAQALAKRKIEEEFTDKFVTKKLKNSEIDYLDEEAKKLVEKHPMYQKYYQYYCDEEKKADQAELESIKGNNSATNGSETSYSESQEPSDEITQAYYAQYYAEYYASLEGNAGTTEPAPQTEQPIEGDEATAEHTSSHKTDPNPRKRLAILDYSSGDDE
jgi:hypothetical protein